MRYLLLLLVLSIFTTSCCSNKEVKKDVKKVATKDVKENIKEKEKLKPIKITKKANLSNCEISVEKTFFWMNKMPMIGPKQDFTPLKVTTIVKFDNSKAKEDLTLDREIFIRSAKEKFKSEMVSLKNKEQWNGIIKAGEVVEIEFKNNNIDSRKVKKEPSIIFNFIDQDKNSATVETDPTRINIAY